METTLYPAVLVDRGPALASLPKAALDAPPEPAPVDPDALPGMFDLILRGQWRLDEIVRVEAALPAVVQRLLGLSVAGLVIHGIVVGTTAMLLGHDPTALLASADGPGFFERGLQPAWLAMAFPLAFLGALAICVPSFYFYTQLSGLDASFRLVTAQALRVQATTSVLLLGALPFYAAWALAAGLQLLDFEKETVLLVGMALPFVVGFWGILALYRSFTNLARHLPKTHERRGAFLRRLVLCWGGVYSAVAPVALYRIADFLADWI